MNDVRKAVDICDLQVEIAGKTIVDGVSFHVFEGEVFGLLGSNGSGKTTIIRTLLGLIKQSRGFAHIYDEPYNSTRAKLVGYLPEERGLFQRESVLDVMTFFGKLNGMTAKDSQAAAKTFLERVDLADKANVRISKLSGGQHQKVQFGITLMHNPGLLILDEPTKALDPLNRKLFNELIIEKAHNGAAVILVSHEMHQVEQICTEVAFLKQGKLAAVGSVDRFQSSFGPGSIEIEFEGRIPPSVLYSVEPVAEGKAQLHLVSNAQPEQVLRYLFDYGLAVKSFHANKSSLQDIFVSLYTEGK